MSQAPLHRDTRPIVSLFVALAAITIAAGANGQSIERYKLRSYEQIPRSNGYTNSSLYRYNTPSAYAYRGSFLTPAPSWASSSHPLVIQGTTSSLSAPVPTGPPRSATAI